METFSSPSLNLAAPVLTAVHNHTGLITLNRPKALNALSLEMVQLIHKTLLQWIDDSSIQRVIIEGGEGKAFCAGGDIRYVYEASKSQDFTLIEDFFREEYNLNFMIHSYPKPYISLIKGICMGGGMGLSIHGSHRIVTETTVMAMPETTIGFFPDVGAGIFLNQCPGESGVWAGLLGERLSAADALYMGLATHFVPSSQLPALRFELLNSTAPLEDIVANLPKLTLQSSVLTWQRNIDHLFQASTIESIFLNLENSPLPEAASWLKTLKTKSPLSLKVSLKSLHQARKKTPSGVFEQDYVLSQNFVKGHDFVEGIRALLIDKDHNPYWLPSSFDEISNQQVDSYF